MSACARCDVLILESVATVDLMQQVHQALVAVAVGVSDAPLRESLFDCSALLVDGIVDARGTLAALGLERSVGDALALARAQRSGEQEAEVKRLRSALVAVRDRVICVSDFGTCPWCGWVGMGHAHRPTCPVTVLGPILDAALDPTRKEHHE